tara:strand:- start:433 stop:552 length:120 start_codon:yes stop_codon:yes gene_type:complete
LERKDHSVEELEIEKEEHLEDIIFSTDVVKLEDIEEDKL